MSVAVPMSEGRDARTLESRADRAATLAPILLGALGGSLVAGRFETVIGCAAIGALGAAAAGARRPRRAWVLALAGGAVTSILLNLYLNPGAALPGPVLWGHPPTLEGLLYGSLLALRIGGAAVALLGLQALWPGERAVDELAGWARPLERAGVPVRRMRATIGLALRFVPLLATEAARIARVQNVRAGRPPRGLGERMIRLKAALIPTLVAALERADRVALALEARHYRLREIPPGTRGSIAGRVAGWGLFGLALLWRS